MNRKVKSTAYGGDSQKGQERKATGRIESMGKDIKKGLEWKTPAM